MTEHHPASSFQDDLRPCPQPSRIPRRQGDNGLHGTSEARHAESRAESRAGLRESAHRASSTRRHTDAPRTPKRADPRESATPRRRQAPQHDDASRLRGDQDHSVQDDSDSDDRDTIIRLGGYVRASLTIDASRFLPSTRLSQGVRVTTRKTGRPVFVVSETPVEVSDSSPETADTNRSREEPATPTRRSCTAPDAQSLSYAETAYRTSLSDGPNIFTNIMRERSVSPGPTHDFPRSPSPQAEAHDNEPPRSEGRASRDSASSLMSPRTPHRHRRAGNMSVPETPTPTRTRTPMNTPQTIRPVRRALYPEPDWGRSGLTAREEITLHREYLMEKYGYESDPEDNTFGKSAWYVVTRGRKTGVIKAWHRASYLTQGISTNHQNAELSKRHALEAYRDSLARGEVAKLTSE